jgi:hypothetical protein
MCDIITEYKYIFNYLYDIEYKNNLINIWKIIVDNSKIVYHRYEDYYTYDNFLNILIIYCLIVTTLLSRILIIEGDKKTINIYLESINNRENVASTIALKKKNDIKILSANITFLKNKISTISEIIDNLDERACKKLTLIKSELIKKFTISKKLELINKQT